MICEPLDLGIHFCRMERHYDQRGSFGRLWCADDFSRLGVDFQPVQTSISCTQRAGTLRGMHWQISPFAETKFLQVLRGRIFDVVASTVPSSPRYLARELVEGDGLLVPAGLAHGFLTLTDDVELFYMMDKPYVSDAAAGARYDDLALGICWPSEPLLVAERDLAWPALP